MTATFPLRPLRLAFAICGWRLQNNVHEIKYSVCVCVTFHTRWGSLKSSFITSKWNEMIMNLYSAKTIEEYSKALYIKLKLMNK